MSVGHLVQPPAQSMTGHWKGATMLGTMFELSH